MSKIKIEGSLFSDTNLESSVCTHLQPILAYLEKNGVGYDHATPMFTDKGGGWTRFVEGTIHFDQLESIFEIPSFMKFNRREKAIVCTRCWCDIAVGAEPK